MLKRLPIYILIYILLVVMGLTQVSAMMASEKPLLSDIDNHWAKTYIEWGVREGIINGYTDGTFRPNKEIRVDEFIKLTVTALGYFPEESRTGYWASNYIAKALDLQLIANGEFKNYERYITREEMASIIVNAYKVNNVIGQDNMKRLVRNSISDYSLINDSYKDVVLDAYRIGLITGKKNGNKSNFDPRGYLSRAEAITVIARLLDESLRKTFDYGDIPYTVMVDPEGEEVKLYAPINDRNEPVKEVITLIDESKKQTGKADPFIILGYNTMEQGVSITFFKDRTAADALDGSFESAINLVESTDMTFSITTLNFKQGLYPYQMNIWKKWVRHDDMGTYFDYLYPKYNEFFTMFFDVLFEKEKDKAYEVFKKVINSTSEVNVQETYVVNNRKIFVSYGLSGAGIHVSDKMGN